MKRCILIWILISAFNVYGQEKINTNGYNVFYHPNGKKSSEGMMKEGKPDGLWINYYVTGVKKSEGIWRNNQLDSVWVFYTMTGDTAETISFLYGKKNGYRMEYYYVENKKYLVSKELFLNNKKEGLSYYYYNTGELKEIANYKNGIMDGKRIEYAEDGRIIVINIHNNGKLVERERINRYEDGLKNGIWKEFYENENVKTEMQYRNDTLNGLYKEYDKNGLIVSIIKYQNGLIIDRDFNTEDESVIRTITKTDDNGNVIFSGTYKDNIPVGIHRSFDSTGNVVEAIMYNEKGITESNGIITLDGRREGPWIFFYEDEKVKAKGQYVANERDGKWEFYYQNGKILQVGSYRKDKETGLWKWYYDNGMLLREENFLNGLNDGIYSEYDEEGDEIIRGEYLEGEKQGFWTYKVGDYKEEGSYSGGLKDGKWNYYYKNGTMMFEGSFIQGATDGKHFYFHENGKIKEEQLYIMGYKEKTWKKYDELGNLVMTITYDNNREEKINGVKLSE